MTYKFDENILNKDKQFNLCSNDSYKEELRILNPSYINECGSIYYDGNNHSDNDILYYTNNKLSLFIKEENKKSLFENEIQTIDKPLILKINDHNLLKPLDVHKYFHIYSTIKDNDLMFSKDALMLCKSIEQTKQQINKKINYLLSKTNDKKQLLINLLSTFNINVNNINYTSPYIPFVSEDINNIDEVIKKIVVDTLVLYIGLDKIESSKEKTITTTKNNIYETYFNYILMDFDIVKLKRLLYDENTNDFYYEHNNTFINRNEVKYEEEIKLIKKSVPLKDRHNFFI